MSKRVHGESHTSHKNTLNNTQGIARCGVCPRKFFETRMLRDSHAARLQTTVSQYGLYGSAAPELPLPLSRVSTLRTDYTYAVRFVTLQYTALYVVSTAVCSTHDINRACTDQSSAVYAMHRYDSLYRVMVRATSQCSESCHNRSKTLRLLHPKPGTIWVQFAFRRGRCRFARWSSG